MDLSWTKNSTLNYFKNYSLLEKAFLLYSFLLVILLVAIPLFSTGSLSTTETTTYWFFSSWMWKTNILTLVAIAFLIGWNISPKFRQKVQDFVGFRSSEGFVNFLVLFMLTLLMFGMHDTVSVYTNNFSQRVDTTTGFNFILIYLIIGLILSLVSSWKQTHATHTPNEVEVPLEEDMSQTEAFKKVEEEFGWLFKD